MGIKTLANTLLIDARTTILANRKNQKLQSNSYISNIRLFVEDIIKHITNELKDKTDAGLYSADITVDIGPLLKTYNIYEKSSELETCKKMLYDYFQPYNFYIVLRHDFDSAYSVDEYERIYKEETIEFNKELEKSRKNPYGAMFNFHYQSTKYAEEHKTLYIDLLTI